MSLVFVCPSCESQTGILEGSVSTRGIEYFNIDTYDSRDYYDSETVDFLDEIYRCPDCGYESSNLEDFGPIEESDDEEDQPPIKKSKSRILTYTNPNIKGDADV